MSPLRVVEAVKRHHRGSCHVSNLIVFCSHEFDDVKRYVHHFKQLVFQR